MRTLLRTSLLLLPLACAGLFGGDEATRAAREDEGDPAVEALRRDDFTGAEAILDRRLAERPGDARSWRIRGDVNLIRGQRFQERWKENLGWAIEAYVSAVKLAPTSCPTWGRLAASLVAAGDNPATIVARETLDELPLAVGWEACPNAALLEVEWRRLPSEAELRAADLYLGKEPSETERLAAAAPWMAAATRKVTLAEIEWAPSVPRPELASGTPFVVLNLPVTAESVGGSPPRGFTVSEWVTVNRVAGARVVYLDGRFPSRVPEIALTRAPGCPGTTWELQGTDRVPVGNCVAGRQDRRASELYDPKILKPAGVVHFHEPSIHLAKIPWEAVADKSMTCVSGPVGRLFVDTPSCQVTYDRAIPQTRALPIAVGLAAWSPEHATRMVSAARGERLLGEAAARLARGEVGLGLPFGMFAWSQPELTGCGGRGVYTKLAIVDGELEFACTVKGTRYRFRGLTLVGMEAATAE